MQKATVNVMLIQSIYGGRSIYDMKALESQGVSLSWILLPRLKNDGVQNDNDLSVFLQKDTNKRF